MSWRFLRRCHDLRLSWLERRVQRCPDDLSQRCAAALQHCKAAEVEEKEMHLGEAQRHLEVVLHKSEEPDLQEFLHKVMSDGHPNDDAGSFCACSIWVQ